MHALLSVITSSYALMILLVVMTAMAIIAFVSYDLYVHVARVAAGPYAWTMMMLFCILSLRGLGEEKPLDAFAYLCAVVFIPCIMAFLTAMIS
jgi:hypothetical protein